MCLVYPNTYFVGMSNLGLQTLYRLFNSETLCVCERAFLPDRSELEEYQPAVLDGRHSGSGLFSLESQTPLNGFDIIAFSVSFEEDYANIPKILALSGIPVFSDSRNSGHPLVMAGGCAVTLNPEPLADIMDVFFIGEAEGTVEGFVESCSSLSGKGIKRKDALRELARLPGVYAPVFYDFRYDGPRVESIRPLEGVEFPVKRVRARDGDMELPQTVVITPDTEFSSTALIEIERGCPRGCRFCTAGFIYLPPRWADLSLAKEALSRGLGLAGRAGLVGAAVSEYPSLKELLRLGVERKKEITVSSLRVDMIDGELLALLRDTGYRTITIAPEAGAERLRRVVNKGFSDEEIFESARLIASAGFKRLKLYFMVGLPTETDEDCGAAAELAKKIRNIMKGGKVILSVNPFVPKPSTPFQWHPFADIGVIKRRYGIIKDALKREGGVEVKTLAPAGAFVQAYLSRSDRRTGRVIEEASRTGWRRALKKAAARDPSVNECVFRERGKDEIFPWDVAASGVKKTYLWNEYQRGLNALVTPPCDVGRCLRCGVC
ncbi:MAG: radical SAM protein [Deltaproteobacteria bacterium]|nr:radical SAM protein [Deltaproteobacteria bacterium]